jgi:hypothetical protein
LLAILFSLTECSLPASGGADRSYVVQTIELVAGRQAAIAFGRQRFLPQVSLAVLYGLIGSMAGANPGDWSGG